MSKIDSNSVRAICECLFYFDFEKVHSVMDYLGWAWARKNDTPAVPSIEEIKETANDILISCAEELETNKEFFIEVGGFEAHGYIDDEGKPNFELKFILESA